MSTTTVTVELTEAQVGYLKDLKATTLLSPPERHSYTLYVIAAKLEEALPDPDDELVTEMLAAYYKDDPDLEFVKGASLERSMRDVLELVRERDCR